MDKLTGEEFTEKIFVGYLLCIGTLVGPEKCPMEVIISKEPVNIYTIFFRP